MKMKNRREEIKSKRPIPDVEQQDIRVPEGENKDTRGRVIKENNPWKHSRLSGSSVCLVHREKDPHHLTSLGISESWGQREEPASSQKEKNRVTKKRSGNRKALDCSVTTVKAKMHLSAAFPTQGKMTTS